MKSGNVVTVTLSDNEACALSMLVGALRRGDFEGALQTWIDEHSRLVFPPDRNAGDNVVALCPSYVSSPRIDESTKATLFNAMGAAVSKLNKALICAGFELSFKGHDSVTSAAQEARQAASRRGAPYLAASQK